MSVEQALDYWHKEISRAGGKICFFIVKRKASKAGLLECATILERIAQDIRDKVPSR